MKMNSTVLIIIAMATTWSMLGFAAAETLAESPHPYPDEYDNTWIIWDLNASQMRIHFQRYNLATVGDTIRLYDGSNKLLKTIYGDNTNNENVWTEWYTTNIIKVRLTSDSVDDAWGFLVDQKDVRTEMICPPTDPGSLAESCHDYANDYNYTWIISNPDAIQMRIHFQRYHLANIGDTIRLYDGNDIPIGTIFGDNTNHENIWTEWYTTKVIKIRLTTDTSNTAWGFLVDQMDPPAQPVPPESITNLHNVTYLPAGITWDWTDPVSADFDHVMVYLDGAFQNNVTKGTQSFTATGLSPATAYTVGTRTVGATGLVNGTWVNHTASTASPGGYEFSVILSAGWNLFSTPVVLDDAYSSFGEIFPVAEQQKLLVILGWNGDQWFIPPAQDVVHPLYAYYVKVINNETATAIIIPSDQITPPPSREVKGGVNLIGPGPAYDPGIENFPSMPLNEALISIENVGNLTGYTMVISPNHNQPGWAYARGGPMQDLLPYKGYWVIMENGPDNLFGFSTTPLSG